jgi:hypothetical protein
VLEDRSSLSILIIKKLKPPDATEGLYVDGVANAFELDFRNGGHTTTAPDELAN